MAALQHFGEGTARAAAGAGGGGAGGRGAGGRGAGPITDAAGGGGGGRFGRVERAAPPPFVPSPSMMASISEMGFSAAQAERALMVGRCRLTLSNPR